MGRRRKDQASQDMVAELEAASTDAALDTLAASIEEALTGSMEEQEGAPVFDEASLDAGVAELKKLMTPTKWMVLEDQMVSLFGHMTLLPAGTVISAASYGPTGIKRIMEQGVQLAPVG